MGKFKSINFARIVCEECGAETIIEPGRVFTQLNCNCNTEASTPAKEIKIYTDGEKEIEVLGMFKNGDVEVKLAGGEQTFRMPGETFREKFQPPDIIQLRARAKELGAKRPDKMKKENLIKYIKDHEKD